MSARIPHALEMVFHYANSAPAENTWRRIVLGPIPEGAPAPATQSSDRPIWNVKSLEELQHILEDFRATLRRWVELDSVYSDESVRLVDEINDRAKLHFKGWQLSPLNERLFEVWDTENASLNELLYTWLAAALKEVSFKAIHQCEACGKFFYDAKSPRKFCSNACRNRVTVRRYRERRSAERDPEAPPKRRGRPRKKT